MTKRDAARGNEKDEDNKQPEKFTNAALLRKEES